jgi:cobalt-zinc-cadmium efflux system membrane fusion protein
MRLHLDNLGSSVLSALPTLLVLALLGAVGWWGVAHDWKVPSWSVLREGPKPPEDKKEEEKELPGWMLPPIRLASAEAVEAAGIAVTAARDLPLEESVRAHGEVEFDQDRLAHLSTRAPGMAWSVEKKAGDVVHERQVLALVASSELARLKNDFQQALLQVQTKKRILDQLQSASGALASRQIQDADTALREARIRLFNDEQQLLNLGLPLHDTDWTRLSDEEVGRRLRLLGIPKDVVAKHGDGKLMNSLLPMYAPFNGVIVRRDVVRGEMVDVTRPQFTVANLSRLWLMLNVRLEDVKKVQLGQEVVFHLLGPDEEAPPGRVTWISDEVDEKTRTVRVRADVDNTDRRLKPYTFGEGHILISRRPRVVVPNDALQWDGRSHLVFVRLSETEFQPRRVRLGVREGGLSEVLAWDLPEFCTSTLGLAGSPAGAAPLLAASALLPARHLSGVQPGEEVASSGSHVLKSEMLKGRITGGDE